MQAATVVLVHGLWMNGLDLGLLDRRLQSRGFQTRIFRYASVTCKPEENAHLLKEYISQINSPVIHFVAHSLGGLIIRHLFHFYPSQKQGNIVTLGTPHRNSLAASKLNQYLPGKFILGKSTVNGLTGSLPDWQRLCPMGVIAGTMRLGLGLVIPGIPRPNDGTVAVSETLLDGMSDHIVLPVSHFGMLLSRVVAEQTIYFLEQGIFKR